jgi:hypothetical protein
MVSEIPLAILSAALRVAATSRRAFVRVNFETDLCRHRQHQNLASLVALRMPNEGVFACGGGRAPEHNVAHAVVMFRGGGALAAIRGQTSEPQPEPIGDARRSVFEEKRNFAAKCRLAEASARCSPAVANRSMLYLERSWPIRCSLRCQSRFKGDSKWLPTTQSHC